MKARSPVRTRQPRQVDRDQIREAVFRRDAYRCRLGGVPGAGPCSGRLTFHHRRKDGQGGGYTIDNGATLCQFHNDELEADADLALLARTMGLVLKRGDEWTITHERFWAKVDRDGPISEHSPDGRPCWLWRGATQENKDDPKYGRFRARANGPNVYAHRFALGCIEGLVDGLEVDHVCRVLLCVNPRHLEQVTPTENRRRQAAHRIPSDRCRSDLHEMTEENTVYEHGRPTCRACRRVSRNAYSARQRKEKTGEGLRADDQGSSREGSSNEATGPSPSRTNGSRSSGPGAARDGGSSSRRGRRPMVA